MLLVHLTATGLCSVQCREEEHPRKVNIELIDEFLTPSEITLCEGTGPKVVGINEASCENHVFGLGKAHKFKCNARNIVLLEFDGPGICIGRLVNDHLELCSDELGDVRGFMLARKDVCAV